MTAATATSTALALEARARRRWVLFIVSFFVAQAVLWTAAISMVSGDPSHAVVSDYGARALGWDEQREQERIDALLGWQVALQLPPAPSAHEGSRLRLELRDRQGRPLEGAVVEVVLFHHAAAGRPQALTLEAVAPGLYQSEARLDRAGRWRFEVRATRGPDTFTHVESRVLGSS